MAGLAGGALGFVGVVLKMGVFGYLFSWCLALFWFRLPRCATGACSGKDYAERR